MHLRNLRNVQVHSNLWKTAQDLFAHAETDSESFTTSTIVAQDTFAPMEATQDTFAPTKIAEDSFVATEAGPDSFALTKATQDSFVATEAASD